MTLVERHGFYVRPPVAVRTASGGTRFYGAVCRDSVARAALRLEVDRVGADGTVLASTSERFPARPGQPPVRCRSYDVDTDWTLGPGEQVNLCLQDSPATCAPRG